jgi:hypothetical protein
MQASASRQARLSQQFQYVLVTATHLEILPLRHASTQPQCRGPPHLSRIGARSGAVLESAMVGLAVLWSRKHANSISNAVCHSALFPTWFVESTIIVQTTGHGAGHYGQAVPSPEASEIDITALGSADRESDKNKNTSTSDECERREAAA